MQKQSVLLFIARLILIGSECCIAYSRTAAELDYDIKSCDKNWLINDDAGNVICDPNMARKPMLIAFTSDVQNIKSKISRRGQMKSKGCKVKENRIPNQYKTLMLPLVKQTKSCPKGAPRLKLILADNDMCAMQKLHQRGFRLECLTSLVKNMDNSNKIHRDKLLKSTRNHINKKAQLYKSFFMAPSA